MPVARLGQCRHLSLIFAVLGSVSSAHSLCGATLSDQVIRGATLRATWLLEESERATITNVRCPTCHHTGLKFRLDRVALEHGIPIDRSQAQRHLETKLGVASNSKMAFARLDSASQGVPVLQPAATIGSFLAGAHDLGIPPNLYLATWARRLAGLQSPEGFWPGEDRRPPTQSHEPFSPTAYALEGLRWYLPEAQRAEILDRAHRWLLRAIPRETDEEVMQICGLRATGAPQREWLGIGQKLISEQRSDGGWAQLGSKESDAYETGRVLVALNEAELVNTTDPVYERGLQFLLRTQFPDGSWRVRSRLTTPLPLTPEPQDFRFPHGRDDVSSFFGTLSADQALILALKRVPTPQPIYTEEEFSGVFAREREPAWVETALLGSPRELKALFEQGLDPNSATRQGVPLLQLVVPDLEKTRLVIASGADVKGHSRNGYTALLVAAAYRGTTEVARLLLEKGATLNPENAENSGWKPFRLQMGIPLFPLLQAAEIGEVEKARLFIEPGRTDLMNVALNGAVLSGNTEMVKMLVNAGADVNAPPPPDKVLPLATAVVTNDAPMLDALIHLGADVNKRDSLGYTVLQYAAMTDYNDTAVIRELLEAGASRDAKGPDGLTAVEMAQQKGYPHLAAVLEAPVQQ